MKVKIYNQLGKSVSNLELPKAVFEVAENPLLISQLLAAYQSNRRQPIAHTKDRGEVSGGGRKPFRQKGTGRARAGSSRSPIWTGGGVVFGPNKKRNFKKDFPQKLRRKAFKMVLSELASSGKLIVISDLFIPKIKTAQIIKILEKLPIEEGSILVVLGKTNVNLELSAANLPYLKTVQIDGLTLEDLYRYDYLLTDQETIKMIEKKLMKGK